MTQHSWTSMVEIQKIIHIVVVSKREYKVSVMMRIFFVHVLNSWILRMNFRS